MSDFIAGVDKLVHDKKFWLGVIGLFFIVVKALYPAFPMSEEAVTTVVLTVVGLIFGISFTNMALAMRERTAEAKKLREQVVNVKPKK